MSKHNRHAKHQPFDEPTVVPPELRNPESQPEAEAEGLTPADPSADAPADTPVSADPPAPVSNLDTSALPQEDAILSDLTGDQDATTIVPSSKPISPSSSPEQAASAIPENPSVGNEAETVELYANTPSTDLSKFIANLSPADLEKVRKLALSKGISTGPKRDANGNLLIEIAIPSETVEPLSTWAESAGEPLADFIRKIAADSIIAYCFQDWGQAPIGTGPSLKPSDTMKPAVAATATT